MAFDFTELTLTEMIRLREHLSEEITRKFERRLALAFSDVVGSTNYFARFGDRAGRALQQRHIDMLQEELPATAGRIVDTAGDGAFLCFPTADQAIEALSNLHMKLVEWNATRAPEHHLLVRVGIHFGPALTDGTVVTGDSVNLCARAHAELGVYAAKCKPWVRDGMLPYWRNTGIDPRYGGYRLRDYGSERFTRLHRWRARQRASKHVMSQSRLVWTFAHTQLAGWADESGVDIAAARNGYAFLEGHFWDADYGGWRWTTARNGGPLDDRKSLCGQVMVLLALVEYVRATGDPDALRYANDTFAVLDTHFRDERFGGWTENLSRDLRPIDDGSPMVDMIGVKSANISLHVMETLAEFGELTGDPRVLAALREAVDIMRAQFLTDDPTRWVSYRQADWSRSDDPAAAVHSYGHAVEHAWLSIRAEQVLGREPSWDYFFLLVDHALRYGFDHERGGLYTRGPAIGPATNEEKQWWGQAEMIAALTDASVRRPDGGYDVALLRTLRFVDAHFVDPVDRVWFDTCAPDGTVVFRRKAHDWQSSYHDVRALVKFADAYAPLPA